MTFGQKLLEGKVAFITGAAQGIGLAVAQAYAAHGCAVAMADIAYDAVARSVAGLPSGTHSLAIGLDVADEAQTEAALALTLEHFGRVDIVVINAGILLLRHVVDIDLAAWRRIIDVNLTGAFLSAKVFARQLQAQGGGGRVIFTSSLFGLRGGRENGAYSASKFGVTGLMQSLAAELAPQGILVNSVCPGQMETDMIRKLFRDRAALTCRTEAEVAGALIRRVPLGRLGAMSELAGTFVYLASDLCQYCTGQSFTVDGGWQVG